MVDTVVWVKVHQLTTLDTTNDANERMDAAVGVGTATNVAGLRCFPPRPSRRGNAIRLGIQA